MKKFSRQTGGCRDQNVPLNLPPLLSGSNSRIQTKSGLFAQDAALLRKLCFLLHFLTLKNLELHVMAEGILFSKLCLYRRDG